VGVGDTFGMPIAHIMAAGMGGIRTSGDLVAWMQMTKKMKLPEAKKYVAEKLGVSVLDLTNEDVMYPLREKLGIGLATAEAGGPKGIVAKAKIAKLLGIEINSVNLFKKNIKELI
jgi:dimethylamine--corrinoid protein Co-methyltransferase